MSKLKKPKVKAPKKLPEEKLIKPTAIKVDQERELLRLSDQMETLVPRVQSAMREVTYAAEANKSAKATLESRQKELSDLCYQMVQIRSGNWQPSLPLGTDATSAPATDPATEITEYVYADALAFVASRRAKKQGFSAGSLCFKVFGTKTKECKAKAETVCARLVKEGHVLPAEDGGKDYWPADPKDVAAQASGAEAAGSGT